MTRPDADVRMLIIGGGSDGESWNSQKFEFSFDDDGGAWCLSSFLLSLLVDSAISVRID